MKKLFIFFFSLLCLNSIAQIGPPQATPATLAAGRIGFGSQQSKLTSSPMLTYTLNGSGNMVMILSSMVPSGGSYNMDSDAKLAIACTSTANINTHGFVFAEIFKPAFNGKANNAFTDNCVITGTSSIDHHAAYQSQVVYNGTGGMQKAYFAADFFNVASGSTLTDRYGYYFFDALGTGTVTNQFGIFIPTLNRGTNNYGVWVQSNKSFFGGETTFDSAAVFKQSPVILNTNGTVGAESILRFSHGNAPGIDLSNIKSVLYSGYSKMVFSVAYDFTPNHRTPLVLDGNLDAAIITQLYLLNLPTSAGAAQPNQVFKVDNGDGTSTLKIKN